MFINQILDGLLDLSKPQLKFLAVLFNSIFVCASAINFSSLARHCSLNERTFRRNFRKQVDFVEINRLIINQSECRITALAMDAAFIKKSGKKTFGLDKFWNGCASRAETGLEASIISLVDGRQNASFALTVDQTEPNLKAGESADEVRTRIDFYGEQLEEVAPKILKYTDRGLFDGFYAKRKFADKVCELGFVMISRLRKDANLQYLYEGKQKPKGRHRKYDGKVDYEDLTRLQAETLLIERQKLEVFSEVVWSAAP